MTFFFTFTFTWIFYVRERRKIYVMFILFFFFYFAFLYCNVLWFFLNSLMPSWMNFHLIFVENYIVFLFVWKLLNNISFCLCWIYQFCIVMKSGMKIVFSFIYILHVKIKIGVFILKTFFYRSQVFLDPSLIANGAGTKHIYEKMGNISHIYRHQRCPIFKGNCVFRNISTVLL